MFIDTHANLLAPEPLRGSQNEPANVKITAQYLAKLKQISFEEIESVTTKNSSSLFNLKFTI